MKSSLVPVAALLAAALASPAALAQKKYDPGASDKEILIGHINPYSGPASAYGTIGRSIAAYFKKVNEEGGVNGRQINMISYDDGYSPPKAVEMVRKLVEQDQVLFLFQTLGTPSNTAIWKYMNDQQVPQLFVATGATKWGDPKGHPWTMGWQPTYQTEGHIYAQYVLKNVADAKVGILYQNDDYGKDYLKGFKDGLGDAARKVIGAYFKKVNDEGGVNGRKINYITLDDQYSPPKTVEMVRRLVEQDQVALLFQTLGTPPNSAIHKYVNQQKVPHLFVATGATKWNDPKNFPWTMGYQPNYQTEGRTYATYVLKNVPDAKVGILYQNDDYGKDYLKGFEDGLGDAAKKLIVMKQSYEVTDPTIDSQIVNLKNSGANVFFNITIPKFAVQAIKKANDIGWKPLHFLNNVSSSLGTVLKPAGLEASRGLITALYMKEITDPQWKNDKGFTDWVAFMKKYYPEGALDDQANAFGYNVAILMTQVLKQCGNDLSRENIMRQAANVKNFELPLLLPGIKVNTGPTDHAPIEQEQLAKFDGEKWALFGEVLDAFRK